MVEPKFQQVATVADVPQDTVKPVLLDGLPLLLVSHQVNITALAGVFPAPGEIVLLRREGAGLAVAGRVPSP